VTVEASDVSVPPGSAPDGPASTDDWDHHWSQYGESAEDNPAQSYRRRLVLGLLDLHDGDRLVDVGSGQGDLAATVQGAHPHVEILGLELGASGIAQAQRKVPGARFVQTNLLDPQDPGPDVAHWGTHATCSEVLEHVDDPEVLLANAAVYLQPGARVVITVPGGPRSAFDRYIGHRRHFTRRTLVEVIEAAGLRPERVMAAGFPFFNLYRLAVVARGERVIDDVRAGSDMDAGGAGMVLRAFDRLFAANLPSTPFGWQLVAVATVPPDPAAR
jgi:SAM-dependent methyltransferase